jgi:preprotein translocase subunit SecG
MHYLLTAAYIFTCLLLLVVVLLQQGKGGDIAAAFGGSSSQTAFGARAGATVLTRATGVLASLFMVGAITLTIMGRTGGGSSVVGGVDAPLAEEAPALPGAVPTLPSTPPPTGSGS